MEDHRLMADDRWVWLSDERHIEVEHQVRAAYRLNDRILVLYDADAYWRGFGTFQFGQFPNLVACDTEGNKLWTAELPTHESSDCYVEVVSVQPLVAYSRKGFDCTIDPETGRILSKIPAK